MGDHPSTCDHSNCDQRHNLDDPDLSLGDQRKKMSLLLSKLHGVIAPVDIEPPTAFQALLFADQIAMVDVT